MFLSSSKQRGMWLFINLNQISKNRNIVREEEANLEHNFKVCKAVKSNESHTLSLELPSQYTNLGSINNLRNDLAACCHSFCLFLSFSYITWS
jgi:hypothetical protein